MCRPIRRQALDDNLDVDGAMRVLMHRRLEEARSVRVLNRRKSVLVYLAAGLLTVAVALIGLGTL
jgi:hypothetical protein